MPKVYHSLRTKIDNGRLNGRPILTMAGWAAEAHKGHSFGLIFSLGRQVDEEVYYHFLCELPPAAQSGCGFLVGEAAYHTPDGRPVYTCFYKRNGKYYHAGDMTVEEFKTAYGGR